MTHGTPIKVNDKPVTETARFISARPHFFTGMNLLMLLDHQADEGLSADLDSLAGDMTDDLDLGGQDQ